MRRCGMDREMARRMYVMLDAGLICYKHYYPWCDSIIEKLEEPPVWIIELSTVKYIGDAKIIVHEYAFSFEETIYDHDFLRYNKYFLACLYLRYERNEISWATFLFEAGRYSDGMECGVNCEYFFEMLTSYENSLYSSTLENSQSKDVYVFIKNSIDDVVDLYNGFQKYFIEFVQKEG